MHYTPFQIECLKHDIEMKFGRTCKSPADFKLLALMIKKEKGEVVSESTLRRIWGYSKSHSATRLSTLTALARCLDFIDWDAYVLNLVHTNRIESDFIVAGSISASDLKPGEMVTITWLPDREVTLSYLGDERFRVEKQTNSKLQAGDTFRTLIFRKGAPMICMDVRRDEKSLGNYIAGETNGLTGVTYLP